MEYFHSSTWTRYCTPINAGVTATWITVLLPLDRVSAVHLMLSDLASLATLTSRHEGYTGLDSVTQFRRLMALHPGVYVSPVPYPIP